jgi:hypothetical protein
MWQITSVSKRLFPQEVTEFLGPGLLDVFTRALQRIRVAGFSLAEPNLEFCRRVSDDSGQTDVCRFDTMFVDINIEILRKRCTYKQYSKINYISNKIKSIIKEF